MSKEFENEMICPYCGAKEGYTCTGEEDTEVECGHCEKTFDMNVSISVDYSTYKNCERNGKKHQMILQKEYDYNNVHFKIFTCMNDCDKRDVESTEIKEDSCRKNVASKF